MVAGPGFEPGMLRAYETGVVAALPAILFIQLIPRLFRHRYRNHSPVYTRSTRTR